MKKGIHSECGKVQNALKSKYQGNFKVKRMKGIIQK